MHYYLFDNRSNLRLDTKKLDQISSWIKTSKIAGEQFKLRSPQHMIEQTTKVLRTNKSSTLAIIGDDLSLDIAISALQTLDHPPTLAYIPLFSNSKASQLLGFDGWKQACNALVQAKRESFELVSIEDYTTLAHATLTPKHSTDSQASTIQVTLDKQLELSLPLAELTITNLSQEPHMQDETKSFLVEVQRDRPKARKTDATSPIIKLPSALEVKHTEKIMRLKAHGLRIKTAHPLLFQGLIQLRPSFEVAYSAKKQTIIVHRKRESLT